jgi:hypothetical protein
MLIGGRACWREMVPLAGIEPALLAELDFESSASTNSATGASGRQPEAGSRSGRNIAGAGGGSTCGLTADRPSRCTHSSVIQPASTGRNAQGYDAEQPSGERRDCPHRANILIRACWLESGAGRCPGGGGDRRGDAGRRLVLPAGAGYPALSALPRAALCLLSGDAAGAAGGDRRGQGCAARRG